MIFDFIRKLFPSKKSKLEKPRVIVHPVKRCKTSLLNYTPERMARILRFRRRRDIAYQSRLSHRRMA